MKLKEIYEISVPVRKRKEERFNIWVFFVVRPLSVLFTAPFIKTKINPTTITKISILFLIIAFVLMSFWHTLLFMIIGWFFLFLWAIFDGVDGNLARCKNECSLKGDLWDTFGGYLAMIVIMIVSGIASYFDANTLFSFYPAYIDFIIVALTIVFALLPRLMLHKKESSASDDSTKELVDTANFGFFQKIAGNLISPSGILQVVFLVCIIFHLMNFYILFSFTVNFGIAVISCYKILK